MNARLISALSAFVFASLALAGLTHAKPVCQVDTGCPAGEPIPQCTPAQQAQAKPFGKGISARTPPKSGTRVQYLGVLVQGAGCTEMACDHQCCNTCHGDAWLRGAGAVSTSTGHYDQVQLTDDSPKRFKVWGDDSLICRPLALPTKAAVVVDGTFRLKDGRYSIHAPKICRL